jgi:hypothetical protein
MLFLKEQDQKILARQKQFINSNIFENPTEIHSISFTRKKTTKESIKAAK